MYVLFAFSLPLAKFSLFGSLSGKVISVWIVYTPGLSVNKSFWPFGFYSQFSSWTWLMALILRARGLGETAPPSSNKHTNSEDNLAWPLITTANPGLWAPATKPTQGRHVCTKTVEQRSTSSAKVTQGNQRRWLLVCPRVVLQAPLPILGVSVLMGPPQRHSPTCFLHLSWAFLKFS